MALQDGGNANVAEKPFLCQGDRGTQTRTQQQRVSCQCFFSLAPSLGFWLCFPLFPTHTQTMRHQINQCQNLTSSALRCFILHLDVNEQAKGERERKKNTKEKAIEKKKQRRLSRASISWFSIVRHSLVCHGQRAVGCGHSCPSLSFSAFTPTTTLVPQSLWAYFGKAATRVHLEVEVEKGGGCGWAWRSLSQAPGVPQ